MSTPHEIAAQRNRRMFLALVGVTVVIVAVVAVIATRSNDTTESDPSSSSSPEQLTLPEAAETVDRFPVNFEHSPEGAVAMVAAYTTHDTTFDTEVKAQARQVYVREFHGADIDDIEAAAERKIDLELGTLGFDTDVEDLPSQAHVSSVPLAAVYGQIDGDTVDVALLFRVTATDGVSEEGTTLLTQEVRCVWESDLRGGDWVLASTFPTVNSPEEAEPGSQEFDSSNWIEIEGGDGT